MSFGASQGVSTYIYGTYDGSYVAHNVVCYKQACLKAIPSTAWRWTILAF